MSDTSAHVFYLIDHAGARRVPIKIAAKDGRRGYAIHPKGKGNDASAAQYTNDEKRLVQAVVLDGLGVRCRALEGPQRGQVSTLGLSGRAIQGYWLAPDYRAWVNDVAPAPGMRVAVLPLPLEAERPASLPDASPAAAPAAADRPPVGPYRNQATFRFADYCCQGGDRAMAAGHFDLSDLTLVEEGNRRLRFSPLGNRPAAPRIALVGITPGGQVERFAANLASCDVPTAAKEAAFAGAQSAIKDLVRAHGLADRAGVSLDGDLNDNPFILTTSIVKCCLMVDGGYRFSAPDIAASAAASRCATRRFMDELLAYPSLQWVFVFGEPGWVALHALRRGGRSLIDMLRAAGLKVLQLPHFAQNFQQRQLFVCSADAEADLLKAKPAFARFAPAARQMREAVLRALA